MYINELVTGDRVVAYDYRNKMLKEIPVTVEKIEQARKCIVLMERQNARCFTWETVGLTPLGEKKIIERPDVFMGFCRFNSKVVTMRKVLDIIEKDELVDLYRLTWESPDYIWSGGALVGSPAS